MAEPASIWPVIIGGALALGGVVVSAGINYFLKREETAAGRKKERAIKFEELVETIYQLDHWLNEKRQVVIYDKEMTLPVSPLAKIEAGIVVHFPAFNESVAKFAIAVGQFEYWMLKGKQGKLKDPAYDVNIGLEDAYKPYITARTKLLDGMKAYALKEFS